MKSLTISESVFIKIISSMTEDSKGSMYLSFWFSSFSCMTSLVALASYFHAASSVCVSNAEGGSRSTLSWSMYTSKIHTHFAYIFRYV